MYTLGAPYFSYNCYISQLRCTQLNHTNHNYESYKCRVGIVPILLSQCTSAEMLSGALVKDDDKAILDILEIVILSLQLVQAHV